jgi:hypothetical protein
MLSMYKPRQVQTIHAHTKSSNHFNLKYKLQRSSIPIQKLIIPENVVLRYNLNDGIFDYKHDFNLSHPQTLSYSQILVPLSSQSRSSCADSDD